MARPTVSCMGRGHGRLYNSMLIDIHERDQARVDALSSRNRCAPDSDIPVLKIISVLTSVSTTRVHGPSSRAELTAHELGCIFDIRQLGPSTRVVETGRPCTARELGP